LNRLSSSLLLGAALVLSLQAASAQTPQAPAPQSADQDTIALPDAVPADGMDVREYVSDDLDPAERDYMRSAINKLPANTREKILRLDPANVSVTIYDGSTRVAHYNRPEFAGSVEMKPDFDLPGDEYPAELRDEDAAAPEVDLSLLATPGCPSSPPPGCYAGSGPYRRIFTNKVKPENVCPDGLPRPCNGTWTNYGYWNNGVVSVNCQAGSFIEEKPIGEAGFVYLGGWSPTASISEKGSIVDAGLQYNYELTKKSHDDYSLFLKIFGEGDLITKSNYPGGPGQPNHVDCENGGTVALEFLIEPWELNLNQEPSTGCVSSKKVTAPWDLKDCGTVALVAQRGWGGVSFQIIVFVAPNISYGGWGHMSYGPTGGGLIQYFPQVPCGDCVFKWMTSIGQKNTDGYSENLTDGSHFSATWTEREIAPWAEPGVKLPLPTLPVPMTAALTFCSEYPTWTTYSGSSIKDDCKSSPTGLTGLSDVIQVSNFTISGETDTISLTKH
jgi:hypothetical protein